MERYSDKPAAAAPALVVRAGSEPGRSLRVKAPGKRVIGKDGAVTSIVVEAFERVAIATTSTKTMHVFILEPAEEPERIEWGRLGVEGRFRVVQRITRAVDATEAWKAFLAR